MCGENDNREWVAAISPLLCSPIAYSTCSTGAQERLPFVISSRGGGACQTQEPQLLWPPRRMAWEMARLHKSSGRNMYRPSPLGRSHTASPDSQKPQALNAKFLLKALIFTILYIHTASGHKLLLIYGVLMLPFLFKVLYTAKNKISTPQIC